jgi:hypothetical protein
MKGGSMELQARANEQVEKRLAAYVQVATDPAVDAELRRMIIAGLRSQTELPALPPPPDHSADEAAPARRRMGRRPR